MTLRLQWHQHFLLLWPGLRSTTSSIPSASGFLFTASGNGAEAFEIIMMVDIMIMTPAPGAVTPSRTDSESDSESDNFKLKLRFKFKLKLDFSNTTIGIQKVFRVIRKTRSSESS